MAILNIATNGWYMLSGRISESVPVRRTRNCETRIRSWRTTKPRPAICTVCVPCMSSAPTTVGQLKCQKYKFY